VTVDIDESTGSSRVFAHRTVVDEQYLEDPNGELTVDGARQLKADAKVGDTITYEVTPDDFGRIAAQTAKQVILQRIREAEREQTYHTYAEREGEIVQGTIQSTTRDAITVALDRVEAVLPKTGQIPGETYSPNQRLRVYVAEVKRTAGGPQVIVSRTHREMLKRLMELEIPEVFQGVVEIKAIAREAGSRSKVSVWAHQDGVDPVGACVGMRGVRIQALVRELGGEKIDIVQWDPDPRLFIANALSPARVLHVALDEDAERRTANVIVPDNQLSLAIGREGQNARLAAKLTGWRIDIRSESEASDLLVQLRAEDEARAAARATKPAQAPPAPEVVVPEEAAPPVPEIEVEPAVVDGEALAPAAEVVAPAAGEAEAPAAPVGTAEEWVAPEAPWEPEEEEAEPETDDELEVEHKKRKSRQLVRDPKTGKLVAQKQRKKTRAKAEWFVEAGEALDEEVEMEDFDLFGTPEDFGFDEEDEEADEE
jgi:N utilization substance protein A